MAKQSEGWVKALEERLAPKKRGTFDLTWDYLFFIWKSRLSDFGIDIEEDEIFTEIQLHDAAIPSGREPAITWWPAREARTLQLEFQGHLDQYPGTVGPIYPRKFPLREGEKQTLEMLFRFRKRPDLVCGLLVAASLFSRLHSSRGHVPEDWPCYEIVRELDRLVRTFFEEQELEYPDWAPTCTQVIPLENSDYHYGIESAESLVHYLSEEHAALLLSFRPTLIEFVDLRDPFLDRELSQKRDRTRQESEAREQRLESEKKQKPEKKRRSPPPRRQGAQALFDLTVQELETLVWSKTMERIAEDLDVSSSYVSKRCKQLGVRTPGRGFWKKVYEGTVPHPNGHVADLKGPSQE